MNNRLRRWLVFSLLNYYWNYRIELSNPRAGVADRQRRVGLVRLGGQKREGEECESDESFHGLASYPFFLGVFVLFFTTAA